MLVLYYTMKSRNLFFIILLALAAFSIAGVGAWFSVYGLTKVFPAGILTFILFGALEFSKIIIVSFVYRFWKITKLFQRIYLLLATIVLMSITSIGIYGFLTNSYQTTANKLEANDKNIKILEAKKDRYQLEYNEYNSEKTNLNSTISELTKGLSNNTIQYVDKETGQLVTSTSIATRKALESQLQDAKTRRSTIYDKTEALSDSITKYDLLILEKTKVEGLSGEIGPLKYVAELTGKDIDKVVNWLSLLIIFVFDPLAIILIVSLNQLIAFSEIDPFKKSKKYNKLKETLTTTNYDIKVDPINQEQLSTIHQNIDKKPIELTTTTTTAKEVKPKLSNPINTKKTTVDLDSNETKDAEPTRLNNTIKYSPDNRLAYGKNRDIK